MDFECSIASRTAGQPTSAFGADFTFTAMQAFKCGNPVPANVDLGVFGRAHGAVPSGPRSCRRSADGDGL
jgi:hypothetical protein